MDSTNSIAAEDEAELQVTSMMRTARASQLRRRTALRESSASSRELGGLAQDKVCAPEEVTQGQSSRIPTAKGHLIRCGRTEKATLSSLPESPPSPFPLPSLPSRHKRKHSDDSDAIWAPSNGCGEVLDTAAVPCAPLGAWIAAQPQSMAELDDAYLINVDDAQVTPRSLGAFPCGCVRRAAGCVACGNVVGTTIKLCGIHLSQIDTRSRDDQGHLMTLFFPSRITPSPEHIIDQRAAAPTISSSDQASGSDPVSLSTGRTIRRRPVITQRLRDDPSSTDMMAAIFGTRNREASPPFRYTDDPSPGENVTDDDDDGTDYFGNPIPLFPEAPEVRSGHPQWPPSRPRAATGRMEYNHPSTGRLHDQMVWPYLVPRLSLSPPPHAEYAEAWASSGLGRVASNDGGDECDVEETG